MSLMIRYTAKEAYGFLYILWLTVHITCYGCERRWQATITVLNLQEMLCPPNEMWLMAS